MDEVLAQKLHKFNESVNTEVGEHISKINDEAERKSSEAVAKAENDALLEAYNKIQKAVRDTEAKYRRLYALEEQKYRMDALRHREELSGRIFSAVEERIAEFVKSDKYGDYLLKAAGSEELSEGSEAALSPRDEKFGSLLREKLGLEVRTDESIELGGIMLIDTARGLIIDKTFDSALEEQRKSFSSRYSFKSES